MLNMNEKISSERRKLKVKGCEVEENITHAISTVIKQQRPYGSIEQVPNRRLVKEMNGAVGGGVDLRAAV